MITCPECGQAAPDDAKFCDRCGQGLAKSAAPKAEYGVSALEPGVTLCGEYRIVALIGRTPLENRYRAERVANGAVAGRVQLRERLAPSCADESSAPPPAGSAANGASAAEDPRGPRAKTVELRRPPSLPPEQSATAESEKSPTVGTDAESSACEEGGAVAATNGRDGVGDDSGAQPRVSSVPADLEAGATKPLTLTEAMAEGDKPQPSTQASAADGASGEVSAESAIETAEREPTEAAAGDEAVAAGERARADLGELFERVFALSLTVNHPAFQRSQDGFAENGRVYLAYPDEEMSTLGQRRGGLKMSEGEALGVAIQVCQAVSFLNRRGLRFNDICPQSVAYARNGRVKLLGLDYVSNDTELQAEPILNDGYTAPEIYRAKRVDKRADVFSVGALFYSCLTGERLESESWREEAGPIRFYPPHVVSPELEQAVRRALAFDPQGRWPTVDALKEELVRLNGVIRIRAAAMTDVGMVREHNEDSVLAVEYVRESLVEPAQGYLYVVADGMGGAEAGEVASAIAVATIRNYVEDGLSGAKGQNPGALLSAALEEANRKIIEYQAAHPESRGMGSTAVSALIVPPEAAVAWVGDSRAYLLDQAGLRQVTRDHSLVQRLIEIGQITPEEARHHEHKNVITRSLGARQSGPAGAEAVSFRLQRGARLMLCSDGLTTHVEDQAIAEVMRRHDDPYAVARELMVAANAGGGTDNVSVIVVFAD
jgi:PPM family protein phosphatase